MTTTEDRPTPADAVWLVNEIERLLLAGERDRANGQVYAYLLGRHTRSRADLLPSPVVIDDGEADLARQPDLGGEG